MTLLTDVAAKLIAEGACTSLGTDLFILEIPESPDLMTAIFQYAGSPPELLLDSTGDEYPGLQVRTRAAKNGYAAGEARAAAAQTALHGVSNTTLSGTAYKLIRAMGSPMFIGNDAKSRPEWSQNFEVIKGG